MIRVACSRTGRTRNMITRRRSRRSIRRNTRNRDASESERMTMIWRRGGEEEEVQGTTAIYIYIYI